MSIKQTAPRRLGDPCSALALYAGQEILGHLLPDKAGVAAYGIDGKLIGIFSDQKSAAAAISAKAEAGRG
jgi:hypothetical protein